MQDCLENDKPVEKYNPEVWAEVMQINVNAQFFTYPGFTSVVT